MSHNTSEVHYPKDLFDVTLDLSPQDVMKLCRITQTCFGYLEPFVTSHSLFQNVSKINFINTAGAAHV